ncbi:MAG TPA: hybrid sensor histidine kinase/response regulator [Fibrobacteria bacterium]|nr:hybrid sensor histidine kinase/response regulator [Fibrobacteria bacterium]
MSFGNSMQTILVADDDPAIHAIFRKLLKPLGVRLVSCLDGTSAEVRALDERPDLVFLDVLMPGRDGTEVCRTLRGSAATATVPILMLSGRGSPEERLLGLESGANDYLVKPVEVSEVSAKVRTYLEISRLHRKLVESERRRAVTGLLRGLAHQFNNILCGISGTAQIMDLRLEPDDPTKDLARTIVQYSHRAATISQQLLVLAGARRDSGDATGPDLQEAVRSAWEASLSGTARMHRLDLTGTLPEGIRLRMGAADLQACLFHVMQNSVRAMPDGGVVALEVSSRERITLLSLRDKGRGMTPTEVENAMEPFYQNWDRPADAGLGLPFVRALVEEIGGHLELQSVLGEGTVVRLGIPIF